MAIIIEDEQLHISPADFVARDAATSMKETPPSKETIDKWTQAYTAADAGSLGVAASSTTTSSNETLAAADAGSLTPMTRQQPGDILRTIDVTPSPTRTTPSQQHTMGSSVWAGTLSDHELQQRITHWVGSDNDPILDRLVAERDRRINEPDGGWASFQDYRAGVDKFVEHGAIQHTQELADSVDALGTSGGYATKVMQTELQDSLVELAGGDTTIASQVRDLVNRGQTVNEAFAMVTASSTQCALPAPTAAPEMSSERAMTIIQPQLDIVAEAAGSEPRGAINWLDLEPASASGDLSFEVQSAVDTLLANDSLVLHVAQTGNPTNTLADDFDSETIDRFLLENEHMRNLVPALPAIDINGQSPEETDAFYSIEDIVFSDQIDFSSYPVEVQEAVEYFREQPEFRLAFSETSIFGGMDDTDFMRTALQRQIFDGHPDEAYCYALTLAHPSDDDFEGVPITTVNSVQFQTFAEAAFRGAPNDNAVLNIASYLPETTSGDRNAIFTAFYDAMGNQIRDGLNRNEIESGSNFASLASWASYNVGPGIRGEQGFFVIDLPLGDRQALADGNQLIFSEMVGPLAGFTELANADGFSDAQALDEYFNGTFDGRSRFGPEQGLVRAGVVRWIEAANADSVADAQTAMFEGNMLVLMHDQSSLQPYFDDVLDQGGLLEIGAIPTDIIRGIGGDNFEWDLRHADSRVATDQLDPIFGAVVIPADNPVPSFADSDNAIASIDIHDFDTASALAANEWQFGEVTVVIGNEPSDAKTVVIPPLSVPDLVSTDMTDIGAIAHNGNNSGTEVDDFRDYNDRMYYLAAAFRETQTMSSIWDTADTGIPVSETWLAETGLAPDFGQLNMS